MRKRIAINLDETICDSLERHIEWYQFVGEGLLFHALHNINATGYQRVHNWQDILEKLR